eukprot:TRINITY_DN3861_c0_g1_i1.p1 TRINITY_DN3861_c0_g1~~TRINITY_DN3861_c0_g1_i1.p1  ORF type:complete len:195 (+),score=65.03 TRINITY_DN3861_c0_g1_i1:1457-2041(+)
MSEDKDFESIAVLEGHSQDVKKVKWHPVKEVLFSASYDDTVKVWEDDDDDWYCSKTLTSHTSTVWDLAFDKTGDRMVTCSDDCNLIVWDTENIKNGPKKLCTITGFHTRTIFSVDWSEEDLIATGSGDNYIRVFQRDSTVNDPQAPSFLQIAVQKQAHDGDVNCIQWNPSKPQLLASCGDDNKIKLWKVQKPSE